jgi:hypothetical protein
MYFRDIEDFQSWFYNPTLQNEAEFVQVAQHFLRTFKNKVIKWQNEILDRGSRLELNLQGQNLKSYSKNILSIFAQSRSRRIATKVMQKLGFFFINYTTVKVMIMSRYRYHPVTVSLP